MQCSQCGFTNPEDARYCGQCGTMTQQGSPATTGEVQPAPAAAPAATIRPRLLGDLLSETVALYRRHLWVFLPIALVPQIPGLIGLTNPSVGQQIVLTAVVFVLAAIAQGAVVHAVATVYTGVPPSISASVRQAARLGVPLIAGQLMLMLLLFISALLAVVLIGIPMLVVFLVVMAFYPQAIIIERITYVPAFRRSAGLVKGNWWRVFGIGVCYLLIIVIPALLLLSLAGLTSSLAANLALAAVGALGMPWMAIGATLLYFDLRVRQEGFDVDTLTLEIGGS